MSIDRNQSIRYYDSYAAHIVQGYPYVSTDQVTAYYPLTTNANDAIGSYNGSASAGVTFSSSKDPLPKCAYFGAAGGDITINSLIPASIFTLQFDVWFSDKIGGNSQAGILSRNNHFNIYGSHGGSGLITLIVATRTAQPPAGDRQTVWGLDTQLEKYRWYRITITYNYTSIGIYYDGQKLTDLNYFQTSDGTVHQGTPADTLKIGSYFNSKWFNGYLANMVLYNGYEMPERDVVRNLSYYYMGDPAIRYLSL